MRNAGRQLTRHSLVPTRLSRRITAAATPRRVVGSLAIGLVICWSIAWFSYYSISPSMSDESQIGWWLNGRTLYGVEVSSSRGAMVITSYEQRTFTPEAIQAFENMGAPLDAKSVDDIDVPSWSIATKARRPHRDSRDHYVQEIATGWPLLSLRCKFSWDRVTYLRAAPDMSGGVIVGLGSSATAGRSEVFMPLHPIWLGLVTNSLIYGICAWLVWMILILWRFERRHRHSRCELCGYPLSFGGEAGCPECGWNRPAHEGAAK